MKNQLKKLLCSIPVLFLCVCFMPAEAQQNTNALSWRISSAYNKYLLREVHQQYADRQEKFTEALSSKENFLDYQQDIIARYKKIVGEFPPIGDLNGQIVGVSQKEGFRIEKIIFESSPKRYVTANLYIPDGDGPFPASLQLCGHGLRGKIPASTSAIQFALNGIAVMVVDPVGQGERIQFLDKDSQSLTRGATTGHTILNSGANLLGSSVAAYEYWDNHRAIDYLLTRNDIDPTKIGVYGSSGGGTQTVYMLGLDERIKVAAIGVYFTQRERMLELYGPADGCQHIPNEGKEQLELADFVLMMAPKPVLIMASRYDNNADYWGVKNAFRELEEAYGLFGNPEKANIYVTERGHEIPKETREQLTTWFRRWLLDDPTPVQEGPRISVPTDELQCTQTGQVNTSIQDAIPFPDYNLALAEDYAPQRAEFVQQDKEVVRAKVIELLGLTIPEVKIRPEQTGAMKLRNYDLLKYQIVRVGQMPVPCIVLIPENVEPESSVLIYLNEAGKSELVGDDHTVSSYINQNTILVVPDLRGFGETLDPLRLNDTKFWNKEYRNAMISMHIGKPIMGQRIIDIMSVLDFIETDPILKDRNVELIANGLYGPTVVHATYLDERIGRAEISRSAKSFKEYLDNPLQRDVYSNVLYGVLKYYDLQDLMKLSGENRIRFSD